MCELCTSSTEGSARRHFLKGAATALAGMALAPALSWASGGHGHEEHGASAPAADMTHAAPPSAPPAASHGPTAIQVTPDEALARLLEGNRRYVANRAFHPNESPEQRAKLAGGQAPFAIILGCADSRVPPEIVFDHGLGDLFVVRVAGNIVEDAGVGSMEYAVEHLGTPLIVVLGHERCGAVKATIETLETGGEAPGHLAELVRKIRPAVEASSRQPGDRVANAVKENVLRQVRELQGLEPFLKEKVADGKLKIVGAQYDLDTGVVEVF